MIRIATLSMMIAAGGCDKNPTDSERPGNDILVSSDAITFAPGYLHEIVILINPGQKLLNWELLEKPQWIAVGKSSGVLGASGTDTLLVMVSASGFTEGNYAGNLRIGWDGGQTEIQIELNHEKARLDVNLPVLNFDRNVPAGVLIIYNRGSEVLEWRLSGKPDWVETDRDSGMVFDTPDTLGLRIRYDGLPYGEHAGLIRLKSASDDIAVTVQFIMERLREVFPGYGLGRIRIGIENYEKIRMIYGREDTRTFDDRLFIHSIGYRRFGLRFDFESELSALFPNTVCTGIGMESPYDGLTEEEIGLGSARDAVIAAYGAPDETNDGEERHESGIAFGYTDGLVSRMRIFSP